MLKVLLFPGELKDILPSVLWICRGTSVSIFLQDDLFHDMLMFGWSLSPLWRINHNGIKTNGKVYGLND